MHGENESVRKLQAQIAQTNDLLAQLDALAKVFADNDIPLPAEMDEMVERLGDLENGLDPLGSVPMLNALRG